MSDYKQLCREAEEAARSGDQAAADWLIDQARQEIFRDDDD